MCESGSGAHEASQPAAFTSTTSTPAGGSRPSGHATRTAPRQSASAERVWWDSPRCRGRSSANDTRGATIGSAPSAVATFAASATARPPWPHLDPVPTIPGPIPQTIASAPRLTARVSAAATVTHWRSPSRHGLTAIAVSRSRRAFSARTVSESETGSEPPASCTYATRRSASAAQAGASWLCSPRQTTGTSSICSGAASSPSSSSANRRACWPGVYGSAITWAPSSTCRRSPRVRFA